LPPTAMKKRKVEAFDDVRGSQRDIQCNNASFRVGLVNLQRLRLQKCNIGRVDPAAFRGLSNLVELDLAENLLISVPIATFSGECGSKHQ